ncbi:MAG TPA: SDR family NAD(P)-dependent oxidoreductase, partial [Acidimicrobiales bacterium]|nr:SDR family NAD(P)-dependent oxidoreductase [Acidimicrobiales bacterium]
MANPTAVVTGAGSGIGAAIARELARRGHYVVATDVNLDAAVAVAASIGGRALSLDVTDPVACEAVAGEVANEHGSIDVWISNAGISKMQGFLEV